MPNARGQKNPAMNRQLTENLDGLGDFPGLRRMSSKRGGNLPLK
jgi:hypothetical protein